MGRLLPGKLAAVAGDRVVAVDRQLPQRIHSNKNWPDRGVDAVSLEAQGQVVQNGRLVGMRQAHHVAHPISLALPGIPGQIQRLAFRIAGRGLGCASESGARSALVRMPRLSTGTAGSDALCLLRLYRRAPPPPNLHSLTRVEDAEDLSRHPALMRIAHPHGVPLAPHER